MIKRTLLVAIALMLTSGLAFAANGDTNMSNGNSNTYASMDANSDGNVSKDEFYAYYDDADVFGIWDANQDGLIDEDEFVDGLYGYYDDNDDGTIDDAEWEDGIMVDDSGDNGFWDT